MFIFMFLLSIKTDTISIIIIIICHDQQKSFCATYMYARYRHRYTPLDQASRFPATRRNGSRSKPRSAGFGKPNRKASPHRRREGQDEEHPVVDPGSRSRRVPRRLSGPRARALVGGAGALAAEV